jgi:hypothetical protein
MFIPEVRNKTPSLVDSRSSNRSRHRGQSTKQTYIDKLEREFNHNGNRNQ